MRSDTGNQISHVNKDWPSSQNSHSTYFYKCKACLICRFFFKNKIVVQSFSATWYTLYISSHPGMTLDQNISASCLVFLVWFFWVRENLFSYSLGHTFESDCNPVLFIVFVSILVSIWGRPLYENCPASFAHIAFDTPLSNGHSGTQFSGPSLPFLVKSKFLFELVASSLHMCRKPSWQEFWTQHNQPWSSPWARSWYRS